MSQWLKSTFWSVIDPLLLKGRSRLEHLERIHPSKGFSEGWDQVAKFDETVQFYSGSRMINQGGPEDIQIGSHSGIAGELMTVTPGGQISIGHHCSLGWGSRIWAQRSIQVGNYVLMAHLVDVHDSNSHSLDAMIRRDDPTRVFEEHTAMDFGPVEAKPVRIEDDVWIGFKSSIMKGVTIGRGAVVAAGSMVTKDIPPYTLVAGNPAKIIRDLKGHELIRVAR